MHEGIESRRMSQHTSFTQVDLPTSRETTFDDPWKKGL